MPRFVIAFLIILSFTVLLDAQPASLSATSGLRDALRIQADYGQRWAESGDVKSFQRVTSHMGILADILSARGDDPEWQKSVEGVKQAIKSLDDTARKGFKTDEQKETIAERLDAYRAKVVALDKKTPLGKPLGLRPLMGSIKNFMYLLDSTIFEARKAVEEGSLERARDQASVLVDLGAQMKTLKKTPEWAKLVANYLEAAEEAARSKATKKDEFMNQIIAIRGQCEECHEKK